MSPNFPGYHPQYEFVGAYSADVWSDAVGCGSYRVGRVSDTDDLLSVVSSADPFGELYRRYSRQSPTFLRSRVAAYKFGELYRRNTRPTKGRPHRRQSAANFFADADDHVRSPVSTTKCGDDSVSSAEVVVRSAAHVVFSGAMVGLGRP